MGSVSNISYYNINTTTPVNGIRLIAGDGLEIHDIRGSAINFVRVPIVRLGTGYFGALRMGSASASGPTTLPTAAQFSGVNMQMSGQNMRGLLLDYPCNDVTFDWTSTDPVRTQASLDKENSGTTTHSRIAVRSRSTNNFSVADGSIVPTFNVTNTMTIDGLDLQVDTTTTTGVLANQGTITGLKTIGVRAKRQVGNLFAGALSTTSGEIDDVNIETVVSGATLVSTNGSPAIKFGTKTPPLGSADTTPSAVKGSLLSCTIGKNPTGDAISGGGLYYGAGVLWLRLASDAVTPAAPVATALSGRNVIVWTSTGGVSYRVYRSDAPTTVLATVIAPTCYIDTTATATTAYTYTYDVGDGTGAFSAKSPASNSVTAIALSLFVNDTFTDTAGVALTAHTGETGAMWTSHAGGSSGPVLIDSNGTIYNSAAASMNLMASGTPASANHMVQADWKFLTLVANTTVGVFGRWDTSLNTGYWFRYSVASTAWQMYIENNNVPTLLGSWTPTTPVAAGDTHTGQLIIAGTSIIGVVDGAPQILLPDSTISATGKTGVQFGSQLATTTTGAHMDNYKAA